MIRRMCDILLSAIVAGVLYSACADPAPAQNVTCATRPVTDNSNACADTAFVNLFVAANAQSVVTNIAALKALAIPTSAQTVYVTGYYGAIDGGEGEFTWNSASTAADDGGLVIQPNSAPASGRWIRNYIGIAGSNFNVRWFGAKGDQTTDDTTTIGHALTAAIAAKSGLYLPATSAATCYLATITVPASTVGLKIFGDGKGFGNNAPGSCITSANATATILFNGGSGTPIQNILVDNLKVYNSGTGDGLRAYNVYWPTFSNLVIYSIAGCGLNMQGTANFYVPNVQSYAGSGNALCIGNNGGTFSNSGPGTILAGQYSIQGGTGTAVIKIEGDPLGISLKDTMCSGFGANMVACMTLDGPAAGTPTGSVLINNYHGESNYNSTANTMAEILVGNTHKFGNLTIIGGNSWGHGDGSGLHYEQDWLRVVAARNVSVRDFITSQLGFPPGFSRSMIRLEATFPAVGDSYIFTGNMADITGTMYSDANSRCTGTANCIYGTSAGVIMNGIAYPTSATSGGIPYFSSTSVMGSSALLAANALMIGGGAGVAPSTTTTGTGVVTAIGNAINTNGGLLTGATASVAAGAVVVGAGSGTAHTGVADVATGSLLASGGVGANPAYCAACTLTTSLTTPSDYGGSAAGSTKLINGTSNGTPSNAYLNLQSNGQFVSIGNTTPHTYLDINANLSSAPAAILSSSMINMQAADGLSSGMEFVSYGAGANAGNILSGAVSAGTAASPTPPVANQYMYNMRGYGQNSGWQVAALWSIVTAENWSAGHQGTLQDWYTTPIGSTTITQVMRLQASGGLSVGTTTDGGLGVILALKGVQTATTTVAGLPTCNAASEGLRSYVTDQNTAVAYRGAVTGGGATRQAVLCSNSAWIQD